jgi:flagellar biosynthesis protein FlhB
VAPVAMAARDGPGANDGFRATNRARGVVRPGGRSRFVGRACQDDVVIASPTHVAVALKYAKEESEAPIVIAKGYDDVVQKIKKIAAENGITMVENVTLARALAKEVEIGKAIPVKRYQAVAEVLAMVYKLKKAG